MPLLAHMAFGKQVAAPSFLLCAGVQMVFIMVLINALFALLVSSPAHGQACGFEGQDPCKGLSIQKNCL
jgi:hypothetical protein